MGTGAMRVRSGQQRKQAGGSRAARAQQETIWDPLADFMAFIQLFFGVKLYISLFISSVSL